MLTSLAILREMTLTFAIGLHTLSSLSTGTVHANENGEKLFGGRDNKENYTHLWGGQEEEEGEKVEWRGEAEM